MDDDEMGLVPASPLFATEVGNPNSRESISGKNLDG
jgi:hypothetical protein